MAKDGQTITVRWLHLVQIVRTLYCHKRLAHDSRSETSCLGPGKMPNLTEFAHCVGFLGDKSTCLKQGNIPSHFLKQWWYTIGDFPGLINWVGLVSGACQGIKHVRNIRRVIFFFYFWLAGGWCCAWLLGGVCVTRQHNMAFCPMIKTLVDTLVCICGTFSNCPVSIFILCSYMFDSSCDAKLWSQGHLLYVSALLDSAAHMSVNNKHVC